MRYSGPLVSSRMATGRSSFSRTFLIRSIFSLCSGWVPWEKLTRATFMPASIIFSKISSRSLAGPMVQMIFVLRIRILLWYSQKMIGTFT